jgi:hypothetical protein
MALMVVMLTAPATRAQTPAWKVLEYQYILDVIPKGSDPRYIRLSPDGALLAIPDQKQGMCIYRFATKQTDCTPWPDSDQLKFRPSGRYSTYVWSPDSQHIAFTESLFDRLLESDLWLFDVATNEFTNRTNDNVYGGGALLKPQDKPAPLDYLPTWNPANGDLYFFRSVRSQTQGGAIPTELFLFPLKRTEPKLVRELTEPALPTWAVYLPPTISPTGDRVALIALARKLDDPKNGI